MKRLFQYVVAISLGLLTAMWLIHLVNGNGN